MIITVLVTLMTSQAENCDYLKGVLIEQMLGQMTEFNVLEKTMLIYLF